MPTPCAGKKNGASPAIVRAATEASLQSPPLRLSAVRRPHLYYHGRRHTKSPLNAPFEFMNGEGPERSYLITGQGLGR